MTRDRVTYDANWRGRRFTLVDTGGWDPDATGMALKIAEQAQIAAELADVILFVVDATVGVTDSDEAVSGVLRKAGKPVVLAANKVDNQPRGAGGQRTVVARPRRAPPGLGPPRPLQRRPARRGARRAARDPAAERSARSAARAGWPLLGKPNVGKSSLLNQVAGEERVLVDPMAGTTRDPVDELVELGGATWRFIDTAGIRRRDRELKGADFYAAMRTRAALERAEVAIVLIDATDVLTEQDLRIISLVIESGRAMVVAFNKWDLVDEDRRYYLEKEIERQLVRTPWALRVNISAKTGRHVEKLVPALERAIDSWSTRVPTARLNQFLTELVQATPPPVRGGKQPKILFATQAATEPPKFVLFTSGFLEETYRRFIERRLREEFGFEGSPIAVTMKIREKRKK